MEPLTVPSVQLTTKNKERLVFSTYQGRFSLSMFIQGESRPPFGKNFNIADTVQVVEHLKSMIEMPPSNQKSLALRGRDNNSGEFSTLATLCFGKDENGQCYIEVQFQLNGSPRTVKFNTNMPGTSLQDTSKEFNWVDASQLGISGIIWWMENILPTAILLTNKPFDPKNRGGKGGGGGKPSGGGDNTW